MGWKGTFLSWARRGLCTRYNIDRICGEQFSGLSKQRSVSCRYRSLSIDHERLHSLACETRPYELLWFATWKYNMTQRLIRHMDFFHRHIILAHCAPMQASMQKNPVTPTPRYARQERIICSQPAISPTSRPQPQSMPSPAPTMQRPAPTSAA